MDSGHSGSLSSSGGDDEDFDSRGESISSFLNPSHLRSISAPQPLFLSHQTPNFFDPPLCQNLDQAPQYNNDNGLIWSRGLRSDHNYVNLGNSLSLQSITLSIPTASFPSPSSADGHASRAPLRQPNVIKNPKKRTRVSRRAPTIVLPTDTTNFRQMVQQFTGIPTAPFFGSPYSRRMDLFSAKSAFKSGGHLDTLGPLCPLRPSSHKVTSPFSSSPSLLNSTMIDAVIPTTTIGNANNNCNNNFGSSTSNNPFQLSLDQFLNIQHQNIQQQPSLHLVANSSMNFGNLSGFLSRETASASASPYPVQGRNNDDNLSRWKSREIVRNNDGIQENLINFDGNINSGDSHSYNLNLAEKSIENVGSSEAEGTTVASWICPSD